MQYNMQNVGEYLKLFIMYKERETRDSRVAVGFLIIAFVVLHVQRHLANFAVETSFVPVLKTHRFTLESIDSNASIVQ